MFLVRFCRILYVIVNFIGFCEILGVLYELINNEIKKIFDEFLKFLWWNEVEESKGNN